MNITSAFVRPEKDLRARRFRGRPSSSSSSAVPTTEDLLLWRFMPMVENLLVTSFQILCSMFVDAMTPDPRESRRIAEILTTDQHVD